MRPSISPCTRIAALVILLATLFVRPASAQQRWRLVEDLRIGGADTGAASFNDIRALAVDGKGQIFVLDVQALEIRVFDPRGRFVQRIGRNGEGPGEFRSPNGMLVAPDGKIWVNDIGQERMVVFDTRGKPATHLRPPSWGFGGIWEATFDPQGRLLETLRSSRGSVVGRFDPKTARVDSLRMPDCHGRRPRLDVELSHADGRRWNLRRPLRAEHRIPTRWCGCDLVWFRIGVSHHGDRTRHRRDPIRSDAQGSAGADPHDGTRLRDRVHPEAGRARTARHDRCQSDSAHLSDGACARSGRRGRVWA
ncbi:MAG: 6-bladed beta-propeller [Gemmatimonadetes bacterium]|nr:6-bladed beta-propeller [Gemmatimonadota bacterium]